MAAKKTVVRITANFEKNLAAIEEFCRDAVASQSYDALLDVLLDSVIPNLEQFPDMGQSLLARTVDSVEAREIAQRLKAQIGDGEIREYLFDEYLLLYAVIGGGVYLLSIRHHKQLSFDLGAFWPA